MTDTTAATSTTAAGGRRAKLLLAGKTSLLIDATEIGLLAEVSTKTVRRWAALGELPGEVRLPGRIKRWRRADVERWLAGKASV